MDWIFIGLTFVVALYALGNWRTAIYICLILDVVRDPLRKLSEQQSSLTTVIVGVVWLAAFLGAMTAMPREIRLMFKRYPSIRISLTCLLLSLAPGMLVSTFSYNNGWILAAIGFASYGAPFLGVVLGYLWPRRLRDVETWITLYTIINAAFLVGSVLEAYGFNHPSLGGLLKMKWIRNYGHDNIALICGFYRSPDVMGLHAAHVIVFSLILAIRPHQRLRIFWLAVSGWALVSLILSGRRKMIVIPFIAAAVYLAMLAIVSGRKKLAITLTVLASMCFLGLQFVADGLTSDSEYARYAGTIAEEGVERATRSFTDIIFTTIQQSGWLGDGLGTVTQGRQYLGVVTRGKEWQEDGVGRLFKELGIPGVIFICLAASQLLLGMRSAIQSIPLGHPAASMQFAFCGVVTANVASFAVSHQAYSGDPSTVLIVGFCGGIILGLPRTVWQVQPIREERPTERV